MKKLLEMLTVTVLVLLTALSLASCGKCRHKETEWVVEKEATCTVIGKKVQKCLKCGEVLNTQEVTQNCRYYDGVCIYCGEARYGNEYLAYREIERDGVAGYEVTGRGNCASVKLEIPTHHNGKPVLAIADGAFQGDETVTELTVGKNVREIGASAFAGCTNMTAVTFAENGTVAVMGAGAFKNCTALTAFVLPANVQHLSASLFEGCTALTAVTLHGRLQSIGDNAFLSCDELQYKTENGMRFLGTADNDCFVLAGVEKTVTAVEIPATVKIVASGAFSGCTALSAVVLPEGVISLGAYAFSGCASLNSVTLPDTLTKIGDNAFWACTALVSLTLPDHVTEIGAYAFKNCSNLSALVLPDDLRSIGEFAFIGTALTEIVLPASLETLGACAFSGCNALSSVVFAAQTGWKITDSAAEGTPIDVSDPTANATALTDTYQTCRWYR